MGLDRVNAGFREIGASALSMGRDAQANNSLIGGGFDVMTGKVAYSSNSVTTWAGTNENAFERASAAQERYRLGSDQAELSSKRLMMTTAGLIGNSVQLGDIMDRMAKGQMDVGRGAVMLGMNFLQLGSQLATLNASYGAKIGLQSVSIAGDVREAAVAGLNAIANAGLTLEYWASVAALKAKIVASTIANALSPEGWVLLAAGVAAAAVGVSLASQVPHASEGAMVDRPTLLLAGEAGREWVVPDRQVKSLSSYMANTTSNARTVYAPITIFEAKDAAATAKAVKAALEEAEREGIDGLQRRGAGS